MTDDLSGDLPGSLPARDDYYMALDGSDDNDGSIDQPFATFNHAKSLLNGGDTLHVREGTYLL